MKMMKKMMMKRMKLIRVKLLSNWMKLKKIGNDLKKHKQNVYQQSWFTTNLFNWFVLNDYWWRWWWWWCFLGGNDLEQVRYKLGDCYQQDKLNGCKILEVLEASIIFFSKSRSPTFYKVFFSSSSSTKMADI